jgi:fructosamine-3-kinase
MTLLPDLQAWLKSQRLHDSVGLTPITGGDVSEAFCLTDSKGAKYFIKQKFSAPSRFFESEAQGLSYLNVSCNLKTPNVLAYGNQFIVMDYMASAPQGKRFWESLGEDLALMHSCTREQFGFVNNNYCGTTPQINQFCDDGYEFFSHQRLRYQADLALSAGLLLPADYQGIIELAQRLYQWIPDQPPSLLHGDLWSGNVLVSEQGGPVFIDPAVYYGWPETDLAMTRLFGGFPPRFYEAYAACIDLEPSWEDRIPIYNLYHLLNHLNLFGESYYASVREVLDRFV